MKSILLVEKFLGLLETMSGLVNGSFSLLEWQAVKMIFFAHPEKTERLYEMFIIKCLIFNISSSLYYNILEVWKMAWRC